MSKLGESLLDGIADVVSGFGDQEWKREPSAGQPSQLVESVPDYLELDLIELEVDPFSHRGAYGKSKSYMPRRFRWVHLNLYAALVKLERTYPGCFFYTDVRRSASESLAAVRAKRGALPPGYSTHGYGAAVDLDVDRTRKALMMAGVASMKLSVWKQELDVIMASVGLFCFRKDHKRGKEDWHYNLGGGGYRAGQEWIQAEHAQWWMETMTMRHVQRALKSLKLYQGEVDGIAGRLTRESVRMFQKGYGLRRYGRYKVKMGTADARTRRVLAFATAVVHD